MKQRRHINAYLAAILTITMTACVSVKKEPEKIPEFSYGEGNKGGLITLKFEKGKEHNHPLFAVWLADSAGNYLQTLYVSESIGKGVFKHASRESGRWLAGEIQRPAALPYWMHQRNIENEAGTLLPTAKQPIPDAYSGATPKASFIFHLRSEKPLSGKYRLFVELNQSWDWNEHWTNHKFPDDAEYKTSSQPALVYAAEIDTKNREEIELHPIGHSHYSGKDGKLYTDLTTLTTALKIAKKITVAVQP